MIRAYFSGLSIMTVTLYENRKRKLIYFAARSPVTRMILLFAVCAVVVSALPPSLEAYRMKETWQRTIEVEEEATLVINNKNGHVHIEAWDKKRIEITAEIRIKASSKYKARKILEGISFEVLEEPLHVEVQATLPKLYQDRFFGFGHGDVTAVAIRYRVKVPRRADIGCEVVNGDIGVTGVGGTFALNTSSGSIDLNPVRGPGKAHTSNGEIHCTIEDFPAGGALALSAVNGDVDMKLPGDINAEIDLATVNGRIRVNKELRDGIEFGRSKAAGVIGGGKGKIHIRTKNGNISIKTF